MAIHEDELRRRCHERVVHALERAYAELRCAGDHDEAERYATHVRFWTEEPDQVDDAAREMWRRLPHEERVQLLLTALGGDRLTVTETVARLRDLRPQCGDVYYSTVRTGLHRLMESGDVVRSPFTDRGRQMWRYRRNTSLTGVIADLDRQIKEIR